MPLYTPPKIGQEISVLRQYSRMYQSYTVVGETTRSWLLVPKGVTWLLEAYRGNPGYYKDSCTKLAKNGQRPNFVGQDGKDLWTLGTDADVALNNWAVEHRYKVKERVDFQNDETMLAIARLVRYPIPEGL
jgi:hypothetical protein